MVATAAEVWAVLATVPDPEIPAISLVDLGVIRAVEWQNDLLTVTLTPTYSGCPATRVIAMDVEVALRDHGVQNLKLETQLAPPWTTDWISDAGRAKLEAYGIAPPQPAGGPAHCPLCKSQAVERISQFGSTPCKAQWRCQTCLEPFDYFKCI
ncbi:ring-1,2-phenylacetyl-CoA epoxidase subunit PaaD [Rubricella aquisinus]|uniref:Ring-1,2-phenylacetyl-CoA epoxidase subunit PaaD n=1 Tax=Rubricella aquisinus TaxID=2028108 RepID=A0A840WI80_9RHOB|nr:1,2-phenylacetyl-CoA epoxidase subunit PaaD [Rubricella aquisinus]MBB5514191.1 ring-1,2-phenylacetyl-CoA epoxidase subunit PaaD [Rubricella aquisinus]